jgi:carboxymethylenebutenolidase
MQGPRIDIRTEDGTCPAYEFRPATGSGPWPGVLMYMDGIGIRPAMFEIAQRLASAGYFVLLPDLYYRVPHGVMDAKRVFTDPEMRKDWSSRLMPAASVPNIMRDTRAFLDHIEGQPAVRGSAVGVTGYCMGGRMAFAAAGSFPGEIAAAASYHPGGLATDDPNSPHRLAPRITAEVYVAGAIEDAGFDDAQKERLDRALSDAGVKHVVETYPARHGWVPSDTPVHDPAATERHWKTLLDLLRRNLSA